MRIAKRNLTQTNFSVVTMYDMLFDVCESWGQTWEARVRCSNHDSARIIRVGEYCFIFSAKRPLPPAPCERPLHFVKGHTTPFFTARYNCVRCSNEYIYMRCTRRWCVRAFKRLRMPFGLASRHILFSRRKNIISPCSARAIKRSCYIVVK